MTPRRIAFFGSSLVSAYWNGAATYYRGLLRALADRGFRVTFFEPDAFERQTHRDIPDPAWAEVIVYPATGQGLAAALRGAEHADVIVKASGVGVFDEEIDAAVAHAAPRQLRVFWDVDAPATLDRLRQAARDPFHGLIPRFDLVFTYGGGDPVVQEYTARGARRCVPIYNALDPATHFPVAHDRRFEADLAFLGNRMPDREARTVEFFVGPARRLRSRQFLLGGSGWDAGALPHNVRYVGHVGTADHNAVNSTAGAVLNVNRQSMATCGFSPPTRVFEAAGAAACIISDAWPGIEMFLDPGTEVLVAERGEDVAWLLEQTPPARRREIGVAARRRVLAQHTYAARAKDVERALDGAGAR